ncbi:MAG TPA: VWA domain-containing protein [Burkholderiaceae bacterium]|nr:VWA domain-containing protein [Burkholderiaceae bacterium]
MLAAPRQAPGHLAENVMHFARVLRSAGMAVGTDRVQLTLQALKLAGFDSKRDFHAVLTTCMLDRIEHKDLFDQAFELFWRDPDLEGRMRAMLLPKVRAQAALQPEHRENRRLGDALFPNPRPDQQPLQPEEEIQFDAAFTVSEREVLRKADFDTMSADEWRAARRALAQMRWVFEPLPTRRRERSLRAGRIDWRGTLQAMARHGGEMALPRWRRPRPLPAPMVVLADISGSMSRYSRMLLHFAHALGHAEARVESFVFGTRLTRTTRLLKSRDPDIAVAQVVKAVEDWSGGTRITTCLHEFNQRWARRCLSSRTTVLLISDGLEHGDTGALAFETERLRKSCRRLLWLNPLLRFAGFEAKAGGIRAMLPHVDRMLPAHNIESLEQLAHLLAGEAHFH